MGKNLETEKRSIFFAILMPMLLLIMAEVILLLGVLSASGIVDRLNQNDCANLDDQVATTKNRLDLMLRGMDSSLAELASEVSSSTNQLLVEGSVNLDELEVEGSSSQKVLEAAVTPMIDNLRSTGASGVFIVLNTSDLEPLHDRGNYGRKPCVHIVDSNPSAAPSPRNDDLAFERAPIEVARAFLITTEIQWRPDYDFTELTFVDENDFLYAPFEAAYKAEEAKDPMGFACWSISLLGTTSADNHALTYSAPIILEDGTVVGVVGFETAMNYLEEQLPYADLIGGEDGSYMLARADRDELNVEPGEDAQVSVATCVGYKPIENTEHGRLFSMVRGSESPNAYHTVNGQYYISCETLDLYSRNSPFEQQQWVLLGIMPQATLHAFSDQAVGMMGVATLLMLMLGFGGSILLGRALARPLRSLADEVTQADLEGSETITLSPTGIEEVDDLTGAISTLSQKVASARKIEQERIEYERDFDLLTGLMNRRAFYRRGEEIFSDPLVLKNAAIVMLDLDNLKEVNDSYGHDCGDKYIRQAARCFELAVDSRVLVSRVSGDEFFLLFYGYESRDQIKDEIEKLRSTIPATEFLLPDGAVIHISASGGVALYLDDASEFSELMQLADFTMYQVKESGKNNIAYFDFDTYQRKSSAQRQKTELNDLLEDFGLAHYFFQPIFNARTGEVFAYEALLRVSLGLLRSPADVFDLARRENRLLEIERLTWTRSLECFEALRNEGKVSPDAYLFVNSLASLSLEADELEQIAKRHASLMGSVVIEITENEDMDSLATDIKRAIPGTSGLFALDDYGSGYSSEVKLLTLQPKFVKVDISIIRDIHLSSDKKRLVSQVIEYAHERDMLIVAEGIETAEELSALIELDVDLLQGFYLARPAAEPLRLAEQAAALLRKAPKAGEGQ